QKLARERDDPDLAQPLTAVAEATFVPLRQCALRLEAKPAPGDLDRHRAHVAIAGVTHPLLAFGLPALEGRWCEPRQATDLLAIAKLAPAEELHPVQPRAVDPDSAQRVHLSHLL